MGVRSSDVSFRLNKLLGDVVISQGGVVPHIDAAVSASLSCNSRYDTNKDIQLLPSKTQKGKKESQEV